MAVNKKKKISREELIYHLVVCPLFILFVLVCVYPFYYLFICTISDNKLVDLGQILLIPRGIHFNNYIKVLKTNNLFNATFISVMRVVSAVVLQTAVTFYTAYFFTKEDMWKRKFWYRMLIATMYFSAGMIPGYLNWKMLGLLDTFWIYIVPGLVGVYNMVLMKTSIEALPAELEESAFLDGAGYLTRLCRIVLPLQKPIIATTCLFTVVSHWNDFFSTKLFITKPKLYTLQFLLYEMLNQVRAIAEQTVGEMENYDGITPTGIRMTLTMVVVIPIMLVYPFIQKYYVKGVMIGAIKG